MDHQTQEEMRQHFDKAEDLRGCDVPQTVDTVAKSHPGPRVKTDDIKRLSTQSPVSQDRISLPTKHVRDTRRPVSPMQAFRLVSLLFTSAAAASSGALARNTKRFSSSLIGGNDVNVVEFCDATSDYCDFLTSLGKWTKGSVGETQACLVKVRTALNKLKSAAGSDKNLQTVLQLLQAEIELGIHGKRGVLV